jgi:hypothetical protein
MSIRIKNNFLEKDLIDYLFNHFKQLPHYYGHRSTDKGNTFYSTNLNLQDSLYNFLCFKISKMFKYNIRILRMYINIQHCFMDGEFHQDDGDSTVLLMITPTLQSKSGCLEIKEYNKVLKTIPFIQNKLIIFPALWYHRGCAPIEKNIPRITLAFKTERTK